MLSSRSFINPIIFDIFCSRCFSHLTMRLLYNLLKVSSRNRHFPFSFSLPLCFRVFFFNILDNIIFSFSSYSSIFIPFSCISPRFYMLPLSSLRLFRTVKFILLQFILTENLLPPIITRDLSHSFHLPLLLIILSVALLAFVNTYHQSYVHTYIYQNLPRFN